MSSWSDDMLVEREDATSYYGHMTVMRRMSHALVPIVAAALGLVRASDVAAAPVVVPTIIDEFPHDPMAFTEGLVWDAGVLYESTGLNGQSSLRRVDRASGEVMASVSLPEDEFGEGLAQVGDRLIQLTWKNGIAHVYAVNGFEALAQFEYAGEGWGLCFDGTRLVMSDGSDELFFRDPTTFELLGSVSVRDEGERVVNLNELECVGGEVFANVWLSDDIVRIEAATGNVITRIDASNLRARETAPNAEVLNGIAHDPVTGHFLLAGKLWSTLFEVDLGLEAYAPDPNPGPMPDPNPDPTPQAEASGTCAMAPGSDPSVGCALVLAAAAIAGLRRRVTRL